MNVQNYNEAFPCLRLNWLELFPVGASLKGSKFYMKPLLNNISHALGVKQHIKLKYLSVSRTQGCIVQRSVRSEEGGWSWSGLYFGH